MRHRPRWSRTKGGTTLQEKCLNMLLCLVPQVVPGSEIKVSVSAVESRRPAGLPLQAAHSLRILHCVITNTSSWAWALPAATDPSDKIFRWQVLTPGGLSRGSSLDPHYCDFREAAKSTRNSQLWCTLNLVGVQIWEPLKSTPLHN